MDNSLKPLDNTILPVNEQLPANVVVQQGEKNVHIDHADSVQQTVNVLFTGFVEAADGTMYPANRTVNWEYYNLFVAGGELKRNEQFVLQPDRVLPSYWTTEEIRAEYAALSEDAIKKIKTYPSLFMAETRNYYAKAEDMEYVFFGFVNDVRVQGNGIRVRWESVWAIPMWQIAEAGFDLGIMSMDCAITEMNRTHWALKHVNLLEEFKHAGIRIAGM